MTFKTVLAPIDLGEQSLTPLTYAAAFARRHQAELVVLHVVPGFEPVGARPAELADLVAIGATTRDQVFDAVTAAIAQAGIPDGEATPAVEAGDAAATIVDQAAARNADLVVMGTHGRSGLQRALLGSVAEAALRRAPCPVLTVSPRAPALPPPDMVFTRVLCAMDFSPAAMQALGFAMDFAARNHGTVFLINVVEERMYEPKAHTPFEIPEYKRHLEAAAAERLRDVIAAESHGWFAFEPLVAFGHPDREILRVAEGKMADLVVMGAQGRGPVGLTFFGSTTQEIVRTAACPVLTVRGADLRRI